MTVVVLFRSPTPKPKEDEYHKVVKVDIFSFALVYVENSFYLYEQPIIIMILLITQRNKDERKRKELDFRETPIEIK